MHMLAHPVGLFAIRFGKTVRPHTDSADGHFLVSLLL
jgi:hypothetical protein